MDPITIGTILITLLTGAAIIVVAILTATVVRDYIRAKRISSNTKQAATGMAEKLQNGEYRVAIGFLEGRTEIVDAQVWHAKELDGDLKKLFPKNKEVIVIPTK